MKKFFVFLPILLASFFLLLSNVKAEEVNISLDSNSFDSINSDFFIVRDFAIDYCQNNGGFYYIYKNSSNVLYVYFFNISSPGTNSRSFYIQTTSPSSVLFLRTTGDYIRYKLDNGSLIYDSSNSNIYNSEYPIDSKYSLRLLLDSNYSYIYFWYSNNLNIVYNDFSYSVSSNSFGFPTLYQLYQEFNSPPPTPPDNTPILTNFINISIEKLSLICNFITSSYIYLTPFVILIFYFVILLFRRFR